MLLKCLLLKLLQRGDNRDQAIFELDYDKNKTVYSLSVLREGWGELGKETNRKTPRRFLTKTRGDSQCGHTRTCSEYPWIFGASPWGTEERKRPWVSREEKKSPWMTESKMSLRGACLHATWQSQQNKLIGRDPHISPLDFLRMTILKIGRSLDDCLRNRGMTINNKCCNRGMTLVGLFFSLFLLFSNPSYSATVFLPDAQWDGPINVSIDSSQCELAGYTYYASGECPAYHNQDTCVFNDRYLKCDGTGWCLDNGYAISSCTSPKIVDTQCPGDATLYKYCVCPSIYKYKCTGTGYSSGSGTVCESKYTSCTCATNYVWSGSACVCDSAFKYSCSGTGYS